VLDLLPPPPVGIHRGIPDRTYHRFDCLSRSLLEAYHSGDSLAQIRYDMTHPSEPTPAMQLGTAVHMLVLEPERAATEVVQAPTLDLRKTADKQIWAEFQAEHRDHLILRGADDGIDRWDAARYMRDAIFDHPFGRAFLPLVTERELTLVWQHPQTQTVARCRLDAVVAEDRAVLDCKTIHSTNERVIQRRIDDGLHRQGGFYRLLARALGLEVDNHVCLFVQAAPPWEVCPVRLTELALDIGEREMVAAWVQVDPHVAAGRWPTRTDDLTEMSVSPWYEKRALYDGMML
jgi:exodeoxyribonuclease VIII